LVYRARSPINFVDRFHCPLLLIQGSDDQVVPPAQAFRIYESLRARGLPVACLTFPGEGHGFRKRENVERVLEATLYFLSRIFGFTPSDPIEPFDIENLPPSRSRG
jgi:dipeptidyl aminopeptidase/acylaminoacyl peptidase